MKGDYEELKAKFFKTFANVLNPLREEIIAVIGDDTYTWHTSQKEIMMNTEIGKKILKQLKEMDVI